MTSDKTVSVVLPVYNRAHLLQDVLATLLQQTRPPDEIIVVDDCSEDNPSFVKSQDPRIQYYRLEKNVGAAIARNYGASKATGYYLAFLDSDDYWYGNKLEKQLACFESSPIVNLAVVFGGFDLKERNGDIRPIRRYHRGHILDVLLSKGNVVGNFSNFIVRKHIFDHLGGLDLNTVPKEDYDFFIRLAQAGYQFDFVDEPLFIKVQGDGLQITRRPRLVIRGNLRFYKKHKKQIAGKKNSMIVPGLVAVYRSLRVMGRHRLASKVFWATIIRFPPHRNVIHATSYLRLSYYWLRGLIK